MVRSVVGPFLALLATLPIVSGASPEKKLFASTLSSEEHVLPARILGHALHELDPTVPFAVFYTEEISGTSLEELEAEGVKTIRVDRVEAPSSSFQIRMWSHTEYTAIVHIDPDALPLVDVSELFRCGAFCASFRHSDKFNSGVFVLRPDQKVYKDLLSKIGALNSYDGGDQGFLNSYFAELKLAPIPDQKVYKDLLSKIGALNSYDGGDQGFLNSYFAELKLAPMFDGNSTQDQTSARLLRLPAEYNFDVGVYYLEGRMLLEPRVLHFTMGLLKPWRWWTLPFLDLSFKWTDIRSSHMTRHNLPYLTTWQWIVQLFFFAIPSLLKRYVLHRQGEILKRPTYVGEDYRRLGLGILGISVVVAFFSTPSHLYHSMAWLLFGLKTLYYDMSLVQAYSIHFIRRPVTKFEQFKFLLLVVPFSLILWFLVYAITAPHPRFFIALLGTALWTWLVAVRNHRQLTYYEYGKREIRYRQVERQD
uniref:Glyco_trans_2-like domain-containing protein n=1 Tax=Steinernema glaseri TaxID=37863 RepID=A0A1I7YXJ0_9BILA